MFRLVMSCVMYLLVSASIKSCVMNLHITAGIEDLVQLPRSYIHVLALIEVW
jgi:hypothetical protein